MTIRDKGFATLGAHVWRLTRVRSLVFFKIADPCKGLSTERTDVRLHTCMSHHVLLQVICRNERFTALFTLK